MRCGLCSQSETRIGDGIRVCVCASLPSPQRAVYTGQTAIPATVGETVDPLGDFINSLPYYCQQLLPGACGTGGGICYRGPICPSTGKSPLSQVFFRKISGRSVPLLESSQNLPGKISGRLSAIMLSLGSRFNPLTAGPAGPALTSR